MGFIRSTVRFGLIAGGAASVVGLYEVNRLTRRYPWVEQPDIQKSRKVRAVLPPGLGHPETLSTTIPISPSTARSGADPLEAFLDAFYDVWSLKFEAWVSRKFAYKSKLPATNPNGTGREFCGGLFPELYRDKNTAIHWWAAPSGVDKDGNPNPSPAGAHLFTVVEGPDGVDIVFAAEQLQPPYAPKDPKIIQVLHGIYMRHLFDGARSKMEKWAREGR